MEKNQQLVTLDGNEAATHIAYRVSEVCAIYPITPSSTMAELAELWSSKKIKNIWGGVPNIVEMQSEGGAAGAVHGAIQTGSMTSTFTASQGLLLMLPNMYKIAGELSPTVFHVAARSLAAQALSIFGDHSDVMSARMTGFAMLSSATVQEAHDLALVAHASTLQAKLPFMHFFDGFRVSHEVNKVAIISDDDIRSMIDQDAVFAHRQNALNPNAPVLRGTAQNPDVYFQGRETSNKYYNATPEVVQATMDKLAKITGRQYHLFDYFGAPDADRVIVIMGSAAQTVHETIKVLNAKGEKLGVLQVRLFRPFSAAHLLKAIPQSVKSIAVLDRTKEPGSHGEPLYLDITAACSEGTNNGTLKNMPKIIGGRYGLSSKEFTPSMVKAIYDEMKKNQPKTRFTIGIKDDVTNLSLDYEDNFNIEPTDVTRAIFYGLGSDGTVGANKNTIKIIGENTPLYAQGYFVYDSKKAGSRTTSHLRFGKHEIHSPYLIQSANFIACHNFGFIKKLDVLLPAAEGSVFLLNSPYSADEVWDVLPRITQEHIVNKKIKFYVIDASKVALESGMGTRINTVMQTCFFAISNVLPKEEAIEHIKKAIEKSYSKKGVEVVQKNFQAVDAAIANLHEVNITNKKTASLAFDAPVSAGSSTFVKDVLGKMMIGTGDELPVSAIPDNGTYPTGTARFEHKDLSDFIPSWESDLCIQCGICDFVCPHSVIRSKHYDEAILTNAPQGFKHKALTGKDHPGHHFTLQIYADECTGCKLCVEACPATDKVDKTRKALNMVEKISVLEVERNSVEFFDTKIPYNDRKEVSNSTARGIQYLEPLFEFSGACAGCGETPYLKLITQLYGDRLQIANATGCSSIYGGNLPTTPWAKNKDGRGPAWANSLFEDNAEFGLGMRVTADTNMKAAKDLCIMLQKEIGEDLVNAIVNAVQHEELEIIAQRERVEQIKDKLKHSDNFFAKELLSLADYLVQRSLWIVGGDGWAYDIGFGGLDHVFASNLNVNVLVMDTEVYSNTGGQMSKATPMGATAKFAAGGKNLNKKDLAMQAISYGNVYVAKIAMGSSQKQTIQAVREAEAYPGVSLIIAYSQCIEHGIDMSKGMKQQELAVASGYWPLFRFDPSLATKGKNPLQLDSKKPSIPFKEYAYNEMRYKIIERMHPETAQSIMDDAQKLVNKNWSWYENLSKMPVAEITPVDLP